MIGGRRYDQWRSLCPFFVQVPLTMPYKIALLIVALIGLISAPSLARRSTPDLGLTNDSWEALGTKRAIVLKRQRLPNTKLFVVR